MMSRAADETSTVQDLDFSSLRTQLGPLAAVSSWILFSITTNFALWFVIV